MGLTYCPERLTTLAMEAVGKIPTHLLSRLVKMPIDAISEDFKTRHVEPVCRYLNETIEAFVPPNMANDVTNRLLNLIGRTTINREFLEQYELAEDSSDEVNKNPNLEYSAFCRKRIQWHEEVTTEIISAVFHSCVSVIRFSEAFRREIVNVTYFPIFSVSSNRFRNIRVLNLGNSYFREGNMLNALAEMNSLEEFSYQHCNNAILNLLSQSCAHIRILDLRESRSICVDSANIIIKFKYLEKLFISYTSLRLPKLLETYARLNVSDTGDCPENSSQVLMNTIEGRTSIASLVHLHESFPNLTHIIVYLEVCNREENVDRLLLKRMKKLTNLTIYQCFCDEEYYHNSCIVPLKELLQPIGNQLLELRLTEINGVDDLMSSIAENCPILRRLKMSMIIMEDDLSEIPVPEFKSVVFFLDALHDSKLSKSIIPKMPNLKRLRVYTKGTDLVIFVVERLIRHQLEELVINRCPVQVVEENIIFSKGNQSYITNVHSFREDEGAFQFLK